MTLAQLKAAQRWLQLVAPSLKDGDVIVSLAHDSEVGGGSGRVRVSPEGRVETMAGHEVPVAAIAKPLMK